MEETSRPATPALVHSPLTARSSFSQLSERPCAHRQVSWTKRHASLDSPRERPTLPLSGPPAPDPPHIHTPPSSPEARPYAYPFLPSNEPRGDARPSVSVDVHTDKYLLACRMPHFDHSSITVATRRGRLLVIAADRWDYEPAPLSLDPAMIPNSQPAHFERRITFGWDADMTRIRAEFDGVTLHVTVPRRLFPGPQRASAPPDSKPDSLLHAHPPPRSTSKLDVAWPLG